MLVREGTVRDVSPNDGKSGKGHPPPQKNTFKQMRQEITTFDSRIQSRCNTPVGVDEA